MSDPVLSTRNLRRSFTQGDVTIEVLRGVDGIGFTFFESKDVVRHPLVARIVNAYDKRDQHDAATGTSP